MKKDNVISYENPAEVAIEDALTLFIKEQAQRILQVAVESEVNGFLVA